MSLPASVFVISRRVNIIGGMPGALCENQK
jgi:hypothetical protein